MAETVASALLEFVLEKLTDEVLKKFARSQNIHSELDELESTLSHIKALLKDAYHKEITEESVRLWLNNLQHLAYEIDDLLDDVATEATRRQLAQESGATTSKVRKLIPTWCTKLLISESLQPKLHSINTKLQQLEKQKTDLGLIVKIEKEKYTNRGNETSLLESDVIGRESEKEKLIKKLLQDEPSNENFSILPIVGMGGVGKTTLARLLYNDLRIKGWFELHAWVCVSEDFDISKISKTIFQAVSGENKEFADLNQLQVALKEKLKDRRFLLVLDDVWNENYDEWEKLVLPFHFGAPGSRVIMTSRKDQLLKMLGFDHLDRLGSLSSEDALSLFALHALGVDNFDSQPALRPKGEGIVEKCGCLPLALKAIGRLLRTKTDEEKWDDVLNSNIWDSKSAGDLPADWKAVVPALMLSYHELSADLKRLFAYCSLFPKDFSFDKEKLVLLWMAEGFLNKSNANKPPESLGREYFEELLSRSFFEHSPNKESLFVMHDLMNDLATFVAGDFFLRFDDQNKMEKVDLSKCHHMSFIREEYVAYPKFEPFKRAKSLRTFLAVSFGVFQGWKSFYLSSKILVDLLHELPMLRVLCLNRFEISEVPEFIGRLKHLRYLNLSRTNIKELPEKVSNLYNLETLIVCHCKKLRKLPKSFLKLKKLRHFDIRDTPLLNKLPLGIGELQSLQTLTKIIIGGDDGFSISELKELKNPQGEIFIVGLHKVPRAMQTNSSLKTLTKLELKWGYVGSPRESLDKEVLDVLKPHGDTFKKLKVERYGGAKFSNWVGVPSFHRLVHVSIRDCTKCTSLPPLGQLPSLKKLVIQGMDEIKVIGLDLTGSNVVAFPSLEILEFEDMMGWEEWSSNKKAVFPRLRELLISNCPKLINVSVEAIHSLSVLNIYKSGVGVLRSLVRAASSINKLEITSISMLTYEVWRGVIKHLRSVEVVSIHRCEEIRYLWESEEEACKVLVKLQELRISDCTNLVSLGEKEDEEDITGVSSLRRLDVSRCLSMECCCCPYNIESLRIYRCGLVRRVSFPRGGQKLKSLEICGYNIPMENINNTSMPMLEYIKISGWINLKSITELSNSIHLTKMSIDHCPSIQSLCDIQLLNLTELKIEHCGSIESFLDMELPNLTELTIANCPNMKSFGDLQLQKLTRFTIRDCQTLESIPDFQKLTMLKELCIIKCPGIDASFPWPPNLLSLEIGEVKKPISEWGHQNFRTSLVKMSLYGGDLINGSPLSLLLPSSLTTLWIVDFDKLESLSMGLEHLSSLQHLWIENCPKMIHLPETLLPSLLSLRIFKCPNLRRKYNGRAGSLIDHIPYVSIRRPI